MSSVDSLGHSTSKAENILIIDLDETLLSVNSFRIWADYFIFGKFEKLTGAQHYIFSVNAAKILVQRKLFKRSHVETKRDLHKLWLQANDHKALKNIITSLEKRIRPNMQGVLELIKHGKIDAVMATAAASVYAEPFAKKIGFTHVIATTLEGKENRSEEKANNVLEFLQKNNVEHRKKIFFTDHLEDMPFILKCDTLMWFGKQEEAESIEKAAPNAKIIICNNLNSEEILKEILQ